MILRIDQGIHYIDLERLAEYVPLSEPRRFFLQEPGLVHYKLLAFLSYQLPPGSKVTDCGTSHGASAVALAYNATVQVTTYDPVDYAGTNYSYKHLLNVQYFPLDCTSVVDRFIDSKIIFLDIDPHNGRTEMKLVADLMQLNYRGLLICDDIKLNQGMKDFWDSITQQKYDVTGYGHWSGTGAVVFDRGYIDLEVA